MVSPEPPRGRDMDVLQKVAGKPSRLTSHVVVMLFVAVASCGAAFAQTQRTGGPTPSAPGAEVYFIDLKDGATVPAKLKIYFGLRNMGVAPAGSERENSGHHHLLVDTELPPLGQPIPNDFNDLHFGAGQRAGLLCRHGGRIGASPEGDDSLRPRQHGGGAGRYRQTKYRPPSPVDRHEATAARRADSQRLQPPSLRRRADRSDCDPVAREAYASTPARGRKSCAAQSPDHVE